MANFSVSNQTFAICDTLSNGLLSNPVSGLMGLAFKSIASSGATPFWQTLAASGTWDSPLMAFHLTRFLNDTNSQALEYGGSLSMGMSKRNLVPLVDLNFTALGFANQSLYTGDIEYTDLATAESYWLLPLTSISTNGNSISIPSGSDGYAAIDTGTTLVGGPSEYLDEFYAQIPGANAGTACDTTVNASMAFGGGKSWPISEADFRLTQLSQQLCLGAFFDLTTGRSAPAWIVGDTFLKNVYSVFRYNPPSVGFAELSDTAIALSSENTPVPSPTIGSVAATVTATGIRTSSPNTSGSLSTIHEQSHLLLALMGVLLSMFSAVLSI
ncbi:hypothetical protein H0H92_014538 [Tricholoma furcatifolium]|nr:hypothetical protein H0H92_014538 [Tricholoma furcatifolium]